MTRSAVARILAVLYFLCGSTALFVVPALARWFASAYPDGGASAPKIAEALLRLPPMAWFAAAIVMTAILLELDRKTDAQWPNVLFGVLLALALAAVVTLLIVPLQAAG